MTQRSDQFDIELHGTAWVSWMQRVSVSAEEVATHAGLPPDGITARPDYGDLAAAAAQAKAVAAALYDGVEASEAGDLSIDPVEIEVGAVAGPRSDSVSGRSANVA